MKRQALLEPQAQPHIHTLSAPLVLTMKDKQSRNIVNHMVQQFRIAQTESEAKSKNVWAKKKKFTVKTG